MNRILVIGGSGFVGEPLVQALREAGENVTAPTREELDITTEPEKLAEVLKGHDILILLTQPNEQGINNVGSALVSSQIRQVIYASTALVYGGSEEPLREDAPLSPASDYARRKLAEEEALRASGVPLTILRFGNVYGGPKNKGIVQKAIVALLTNKPLETSGENQVRDFIHVDDVVAAILALLSLPPAELRVVNIMTGTGTTIGELFTTLERLTGITLVRSKGREKGSLNIIGNIDTLQKLTGFHPKISLEEGLIKTLHAYNRSIQK